MELSREELAARNRALAAKKHAGGRRRRWRRRLLWLLARLPSSPPAIPVREDAILLIRPDHLGDVLFMTPAIRALRKALPRAELNALVGPWSAGVLAPIDELTRVLTLRFPGFERDKTGRGSPGVLSAYRLAWQSALQLRTLGLGAAVIMRPDHWWGALIAHLAGIPVRLGYDVPEVRPFLSDSLPYPEDMHSVRLNLNLLDRWTGAIDTMLPLQYPIFDEDRAYVDDLLAEHGCTPGMPVVMIHPGSGSSYKNWLVERWAQVADGLAARLDARVVLTGAAHEAHRVRDIARGMRGQPVIAVGGTTLGQLAALCARSMLVLGPDSGPLHLAVAVGTPTVHLYGPAKPALYGPWGDADRHRVLQSALGCVPCAVLDWSDDDPALHPCIRDMTVAQVLAAACDALA